MKAPFNTKFQDEYDYYKIDLENPIEELRPDLKAIPLAIKLGYQVVEGKTFADEVKFTKGNVHVWEAGIKVIKATIINGSFANHKHYDTFGEALKEGEETERSKKNCKCFNCKYARALDIKGKLIKGLTGNTTIVICIREPHKAGDTGYKPKLHCDWFKKGAPLDSYYLVMGK